MRSWQAWNSLCRSPASALPVLRLKGASTVLTFHEYFIWQHIKYLIRFEAEHMQIMKLCFHSLFLVGFSPFL